MNNRNELGRQIIEKKLVASASTGQFFQNLAIDVRRVRTHTYTCTVTTIAIENPSVGSSMSTEAHTESFEELFNIVNNRESWICDICKNQKKISMEMHCPMCNLAPPTIIN